MYSNCLSALLNSTPELLLGIWRFLTLFIQSFLFVTPNFQNKIECISYVRQDQVYTNMIDIISEYIKRQCSKHKQERVNNFITFRQIDTNVFNRFTDILNEYCSCLFLHRRLTGECTPRTPRSRCSSPLQHSLLNNILARVSILMVGTQQVGGECMAIKRG